MTTEVHLGFNELRGMVIATQRYGGTIAKDGGTFSEGHAGNEYQALARKVDQLVLDSEPEQHFLIMHEKEVLATELAAELACSTLRAALQQEMEKTRKQTEFIDKIRMALGTMGLPLDAIFGTIKTMQEDLDMYEKKAEKDAAPKSLKKSAKKKK